MLFDDFGSLENENPCPHQGLSVNMILFIIVTQALQAPLFHFLVFPPCTLGKGMGVCLGITMLKGRLRLPLKLVSLGARGLPAFPLLVPVVGTRREEAGAWLIPAKTASPLPSGRSFPMLTSNQPALAQP